MTNETTDNPAEEVEAVAENQPVVALRAEEQPKATKPARKVARTPKAAPAPSPAPIGAVKCAGTQKNGEPCRMPVIKGTTFCFNHLSAEERESRGFKPNTPVAGPRVGRWPTATFEDIEIRVKKGTKVVLNGTAKVYLATVDGKPTLTVEHELFL